MDGSSLTEPSPGPSPASPASKTSPSSFSPDFRSRSSIAEKGKGGPADAQFFELQRPTTPAKKPRNLKNLAVNTSSLSFGRSASTAALPVTQNLAPSTSSAPSSPSFVKPPTPPRRRPSNLALTLQTGNTGTIPTLSIPPTPSLKRPNTLRHFQSSPSLSLYTPSVAPSGGMQLPPPARAKPPPHGFAEVPMEDEEEEQEPNFDVPQSREEKPAAYPNGPICIYESGVYLYFEPTAEQASNYDVVLNVASEVLNPFNKASHETNGDAKSVSTETQTPPAKPKLTQPSDRTFADPGSAPQATIVDPQGSSPTTPKATPVFGSNGDKSFLPTSKPEYIHIPWEHNTDIVPDLYTLVRIIDDRVQRGKRVLVHCQCGVSRSASLIVAYGLYKNPGISVQEAYDAVKKRSRWIGPNMNLIMQLQEFRNGLLRANGHSQGYKSGIPRRLSPNPATSCNDPSQFDRDSSGSRTPATAPLPPEYGPDLAPQRASTGNMIPISPGPTSAPSGLAWMKPGFRRTWDASQVPVGSPIEQPFVDPMGHVIPVVTIQARSNPATPAIPATSEPEPEPEKGRSDSTATIRPYPNFSRQFPLRQHKEEEDDHHTTEVPNTNVMETPSEQEQQQDSLERVPSHNHDQDARSTHPPTPATGRPMSNLQKRRMNKPKQLAEPFSPKSGFLASMKPKHIDLDNLSGLSSPLSANFTFDDRPRPDRPNDSVISMSDRLVDGPPIPLEKIRLGLGEPIATPRSEEFHMAPFVPKDEPDDDFGLLSPTRYEFPKNPFDSVDTYAQDNKTPVNPGDSPSLQPKVHAILPPVSESDRPPSSQFQSFGFLSTKPSLRSMTPLQISKTAYPPSEEPSPMAGTFAGHNQDVHLSAAEPKLRTKFSNPDMQSQKRLRALQTQMEAQLPNHSNSHTADELAALMSPRAHEFTQNPFHATLEATLGSPPPVHNGRSFDARQEILGTSSEPQRMSEPTTPRPLEVDPRSPAQTGVSPITRNIWDVL